MNAAELKEKAAGTARRAAQVITARPHTTDEADVEAHTIRPRVTSAPPSAPASIMEPPMEGASANFKVAVLAAGGVIIIVLGVLIAIGGVSHAAGGAKDNTAKAGIGSPGNAQPVAAGMQDDTRRDDGRGMAGAFTRSRATDVDREVTPLYDSQHEDDARQPAGRAAERTTEADHRHSAPAVLDPDTVARLRRRIEEHDREDAARDTARAAGTASDDRTARRDESLRAAPESDTSAAASGPYVVQEGDSLWLIARKFYRDGGKWPAIAKANPSIDPHRLREGDRIIVPSAAVLARRAHRAETSGPRRAANASTASRRPATVVVKEGDTLFDLAKALYDDGQKWDKLYEANRHKLRSPDHIRKGMRLIVP